MPDPFNRVKMTGDFHPPDVESDLPLEEGGRNAAPGSAATPSDRGQASERGRDRPGRAGGRSEGDPGSGADRKR